MSQDFFMIDKLALDEECIMLTKNYSEAVFELVEAQKEYERAKADKELIIAELDTAIRNFPEKHGISKITETVVERTIQLNEKFQNAQNKVLERKHTLDTHKAMVDSLDVKKKSLELLVQLDSRDYFSEVKVPAKFREEKEEREKQRVRHLGQKSVK